MRQNPVASLPLFANAEGRFPLVEIVPVLRISPTEKGDAGAADAEKHLRDHCPAFVLEALGNALMAHQGLDFTFEQVRVRAEQSEAVRGWLGAKGRENCFAGWARSRIRLHKLERAGKDAIALRGQRRGARLPYWRFPTNG